MGMIDTAYRITSNKLLIALDKNIQITKYRIHPRHLFVYLYFHGGEFIT